MYIKMLASCNNTTLHPVLTTRIAIKYYSDDTWCIAATIFNCSLESINNVPFFFL